jgi:hypothetical protein
MKIMLAIPCYKCEIQIPRVLASLKKSNYLDKISHIAIIDNRSPDSTLQAALKAVKDLSLESTAVYQNTENYGLGGTHKVAFQLAAQLEMDYVVIIHGDDQADTDDVELFIKKIESSPSLVAVLGSRFSKKSKLIGYQKMRIYGNLVLNFIYTCLTLRKTTDLGAGLNLFNVKEINKIDFSKIADHFIFNTELLLELYKRKLSFFSMPITWREQDQQSNVKNFTVARQMFFSLILWRLNISKKSISRKYTTSKILS